MPLPVIDSLIAATALVHGYTVVTRNIEDFERCGATCISPGMNDGNRAEAVIKTTPGS